MNETLRPSEGPFPSRFGRSRPWAPVALAAAVSALLLALAGDPLGLREEPVPALVVDAPRIETLAPAREVVGWPVEFRWEPVADTVYYLVGYARLTPDGPVPVHRGTTEGTRWSSPEPGTADLGFESGQYAWEVLAFGADGLPHAKGSGTFRVLP